MQAARVRFPDAPEPENAKKARTHSSVRGIGVVVTLLLWDALFFIFLFFLSLTECLSRLETSVGGCWRENK